MDKQFLGEFEQMVLLATLRLGDGAYAVPIREEIEREASRRVSRGALYTTLERLEAKGLLASRFGDGSDERGGRARRYYSVTEPARAALREAREAMANLWRGVENLVEGR
jgi:DNA-binding PadR family transcriptional regulator